MERMININERYDYDLQIKIQSLSSRNLPSALLGKKLKSRIAINYLVNRNFSFFQNLI
jgi:hypothetical protein